MTCETESTASDLPRQCISGRCLWRVPRLLAFSCVRIDDKVLKAGSNSWLSPREEDGFCGCLDDHFRRYCQVQCIECGRVNSCRGTAKLVSMHHGTFWHNHTTIFHDMSVSVSPTHRGSNITIDWDWIIASGSLFWTEYSREYYIV